MKLYNILLHDILQSKKGKEVEATKEVQAVLALEKVERNRKMGKRSKLPRRGKVMQPKLAKSQLINSLRDNNDYCQLGSCSKVKYE